MRWVFAYWWMGNNFGDLITPYLIWKMTGKQAVWTERANVEEGTLFMAAGSVLGENLENVVVWGTGAIHAGAVIGKAKEFRAIRGPLTREIITKAGWECPEIYGDPGILLPYYHHPSVKKTHDVGLVPHYADLADVVEAYGNDQRVKIIRVTEPVETVISEILACRTILSSSLHGIVVAETYGIPCAWVEFSDRVVGNGFKFRDYWAGVGAKPLDPVDLRTKGPLVGAVKKARQSLIPGLLKERLLSACPWR
jgi:pyruvyltransferase